MNSGDGESVPSAEHPQLRLRRSQHHPQAVHFFLNFEKSNTDLCVVGQFPINYVSGKSETNSSYMSLTFPMPMGPG
jgi:hypothetical protein